MFDGKAEEVMNFYVSLFKKSKILSITRYGPNEAGTEGTVMHATFLLGGQEFMCIDSNIKQEFTFTPLQEVIARWANIHAIKPLSLQRKVRLGL